VTIDTPILHNPIARLSILLFGSILILTGCASQTGQEEPPVVPTILWPAPPEIPRFIYETTLRSPADIELPVEQKLLRRLLTAQTERKSTQPAFQKPGALVARHGRIYIADTATSMIVVFDIPRNKVFRFGRRNPGTIVKPVGLALDDMMNVYVADATNRQVFVYDSLGLFLKAIGDPTELERPTGVAVNSDGSRIYIVDRASNESDQHRVVIYDSSNNKISEIGGRGSAPGQFNISLAAATAPDGTLYVLDAGNFRIQAFDPQGQYLRSFGQVGSGLGDFARPRSLAVDDEGNVYVIDTGFGNFQIFNPQGQLLLSIGQISKNDEPGRYALISGIAVDETRRVYVADQTFKKVEVIRRLDEQEARKFLDAVQ